MPAAAGLVVDGPVAIAVVAVVVVLVAVVLFAVAVVVVFDVDVAVVVVVVVGKLHLYERNVYPDLHLSQPPEASQLVHSDALHCHPAHRPSLHSPDSHELSLVQSSPSCNLHSPPYS